MKSPCLVFPRYPTRRPSALIALALVLSCAALGKAFAAPGAHGPNGEHLDAAGSASGTSGLARLPDGSVQVPLALPAASRCSPLGP
jgi:membrane fusion protein, heavy metal efflux system